MKANEVRMHPLYQTIKQVSRYGKRNFGVLAHPSYYGYKREKPTKLTAQWNHWEKQALKLLKEEKIDECNLWIKMADCERAKYSHLSIGYHRAEECMWNVINKYNEHVGYNSVRDSRF